MKTPTGIFTRTSTGLVREVGKLDIIHLNVFYINLPLGFLVFTTAPFIWPGVNLGLAYLITVIILLIPAILYGMMAATMPRSGGDYIFISRILHPLPAVALVITFMFVLAMFVSAFASWHTMLGLTPMLTIFGMLFNNEGLKATGATLGQPGWVFLIGCVVIGCAWFLAQRGWNAIIPTMRIMWAVILAGIIATLLMMITTTADEFAIIFSKYAAYGEVIENAANAGFPVGATSSAVKVAGLIALGWTVLAFFQFPCWIGGEIKAPKFTAIFGSVGALLTVGGLLTIAAYLIYPTFGPDFMGAMSFLFSEAPGLYPNLPEPMFFMYTMMLTGNPLLLILIGVGFIFAIFTGMFVIWCVVSRMILACALDRILPDWLAEVHPRFHTPTRINAVFSILCIAMLAIYVFGPALVWGFIYSAALAEAFLFLGTGLAALLLPWRRPDILATSPFNQRIAGIPILSIFGFFQICLLSWVIYVLSTNADIGANDPFGLVSIGVMFAIGFSTYFIARWIQGRRGVDISLAFREIPPE